MRAVVLFCACACSLSGVCGQNIVNTMKNMPKYDVRYDYLDIDAILDSNRLVKNYVDCLINVKPCTPEGKALKRILPEALRTKCVRCTEKQKKTAVKVIRRLKYEYPQEWAKLASRWDPTGDFTRYFEEFLAKDNFNSLLGNGNEIPGSAQTRPPPPTPPPRLPEPSTPQPAISTESSSTSPRPVLLNRFGDDGELEISPSPEPASVRPVTTRPTMRPAMPPRYLLLHFPARLLFRPTLMAGAASDMMPTRFPLRPVSNMQPPYSTAITFIDQIGYKIIRTTELVTDILKNTMLAVVGQ